MALKINTKYKAKAISYDSEKKRSLSDIKYIVIHYTGNSGDKAESNAKYFAKANTRQAGAHFFVDKFGKVYKSIDMVRTAWAVGGDQRNGDGGGKLYKKCTNSNSVSIELCDCIHETNYDQLLACRQLVKYIQSKCPNATHIVRHWDVNGKQCPGPMTGKSNKQWIKVHNFLQGDCEFMAKVTDTVAVRAAAKVSGKKVGTLTPGATIKVVKEVGNWGKVIYDGKPCYITLNKIRFK